MPRANGKQGKEVEPALEGRGKIRGCLLPTDTKLGRALFFLSFLQKSIKNNALKNCEKKERKAF